MCARSFVPSYIFEGLHAPLVLSTPCHLHAYLKQCFQLRGRCLLVLLLLSYRLRLSSLLVVLFRMSISVQHSNMIAHILLRSFVCTKTRTLRYISQLAAVHSFLVLLSSAVLLLLFAAVAALPCTCFSICFVFFRACVAPVRYDMFVWQEGECL